MYFCVIVIITSTWRWLQYRPKPVGENTVNITHHQHYSAFFGYLCIMDLCKNNIKERYLVDISSVNCVILNTKFYITVRNIQAIVRKFFPLWKVKLEYLLIQIFKIVKLISFVFLTYNIQLYVHFLIVNVYSFSDKNSLKTE